MNTNVYVATEIKLERIFRGRYDVIGTRKLSKHNVIGVYKDEETFMSTYTRLGYIVQPYKETNNLTDIVKNKQYIYELITHDDPARLIILEEHTVL